MDTSNRTQIAQGGEPAMNADDWRASLTPESRERIINKIVETLKRHLPFSGQEGLEELEKIAVRFEEKIYAAAVSQSDYLRKISLKMLSMESKSQNTMSDSLPPNPSSNNNRPPDTGASVDSMAQTGHANGGDWQEEIYQKIRAMNEMYLPELIEMHNKFATKLLQHDSLPQQPKTDQLDKLKMFKTMLERIITFLQVPKNSVVPAFREKLGPYEKQIQNFVSTNRPRKPVTSMQQGQPPQSHIQQPQSQSQGPLVQSHENQMKPRMQSMNMQPVSTMQQNMSSLQPNSLSALSGVSTSQQNVMNALQAASNLVSGEGNAMSSLQLAGLGSQQQNPWSTSQQAYIFDLSSQSGVHMFQPDFVQMNPDILQHQYLKQQQEQESLQNQEIKQQLRLLQQRQELLQKQWMLLQQQLHLQAEQQFPGQIPAQQMPQVHQMIDVNELEIKQGMGVKSGDGGKPVSGIPLMSKAGNFGQKETNVDQAPCACLAIETMGTSATPLLAEFSGCDGGHGNPSSAPSGKSTGTEQLIRLTKVFWLTVLFVYLLIVSRAWINHW